MRLLRQVKKRGKGFEFIIWTEPPLLFGCFHDVDASVGGCLDAAGLAGMHQKSHIKMSIVNQKPILSDKFEKCS